MDLTNRPVRLNPNPKAQESQEEYHVRANWVVFKDHKKAIAHNTVAGTDICDVAS